MIDVDGMIPNPGETKSKFKRRVGNVVDLNLNEVYKRKHGEKAEDHYYRIDDYQGSTEAKKYVFQPRYVEDHSSDSFIRRVEWFMINKKRIMEDFENEILKLMRRKKGETLQDWLNRSNGILYKYSFLIDESRFEFNESFAETENRKDKFRDIRDEIKVQIRTEEVKARYNDKVKLAREVEEEKEKVRSENEIKKEFELKIKEEQLEENEELERIKKVDDLIYLFFLFLCFSFICYFLLVGHRFWFYNSMMTLISSGIICFPAGLYLWDKEWNDNKIFTTINNTWVYRAIMVNFYKMVNGFFF